MYFCSEIIVAMLLKSQIEEVIASQNGNKAPRGQVAREQRMQVPQILHFASIITGIRRCGKSTLMGQIMRSFPEGEALYLNFDDINLMAFEQDDFTRLYKVIVERHPKALFFDEPQLVRGWEIFVHQLLREDYYVYVSGSNASMLSVELGTHLTGRHLSMELFPFSFNEYLLFARQEQSLECFETYLKEGGMPEYLQSHERRVMQSLFDDILIRDIAVRKGIRNVDGLRGLALYLLTNVAKPFTANRLSTMMENMVPSTLLEYVGFMRDAYLIDTIGLYSDSIRATARNPKKVYAMDNGLVSAVTLSRSQDWGRLLENYQFICLRKKHKGHVYYYKGKGECDFVVTDEANHPMELYQVCWELTDENNEREMGGLREAMKALKLKEGFVVTMNQEDEFHYSEGVVHVVRAMDLR